MNIDEWIYIYICIYICMYVNEHIFRCTERNIDLFLPECVARVPVSLRGFDGGSSVASTFSLYLQPSETVRNCSRAVVWGPYGRAFGTFWSKCSHIFFFYSSLEEISIALRLSLCDLASEQFVMNSSVDLQRLLAEDLNRASWVSFEELD